MFLRSLARIYINQITKSFQVPLGCFNFSETAKNNNTYQAKKAERYLQKQRQNFITDQSSITSQTIVAALVPNFFTDTLTLFRYPQGKVDTPNTNTFHNSYSRVVFPLSSQPKLRQKLNKLNDKEVRLGRIFQIMDSIAGIVSYRHCFGGFAVGDSAKNEMVCVTGSVELLRLFDHIDIVKDMTIEGYLNYAGNTAMEIQINVIQQNKLKANSLFTMVARKANNQKQGYKIPSLSYSGLTQIQTKKALIRAQNAKLNIIRRKQEMQNSYDRKQPSQTDIQQIHEMFLKRKFEAARMQFSSVPISKTLIENCEIMHTQKRNVHGKIFGGFLIRQMIEIAWVAGCKYSEDYIIMEDLTNIYFKQPVDIGSRLTLKAKVTYVQANRLVVTVEAFTSKFTENRQTLACYLHLVSRSSKPMTKVHPETYEQSLLYLSSRKAFHELFE